LQFADAPAAPSAPSSSMPAAYAWPQEFEKTAPIDAPRAETAVAAAPRPDAAPDAEFVVLSRKAIRVLPWWGISVAIHALAFGALLLLPKPPAEKEVGDSTFAVTLRQAPTRVEMDDTPPIEPSRRGVDVARPDVDVAAPTP